jgi:hypothetical protein
VAVFARAGAVLSNISSTASTIMKAVPLISNFPQFLNSSFLGLFNVTSMTASAASTSFSGGLFDPEKIALLVRELRRWLSLQLILSELLLPCL